MKLPWRQSPSLVTFNLSRGTEESPAQGRIIKNINLRPFCPHDLRLAKGRAVLIGRSGEVEVTGRCVGCGLLITYTQGGTLLTALPYQVAFAEVSEL